LNPDLKVAGILFNMCEGFQEINAQLSNEALQHIKHIAVSTTIPNDVTIQDSYESGKPVALYDMGSDASISYLNVSIELMHILMKTDK